MKPATKTKAQIAAEIVAETAKKNFAMIEERKNQMMSRSSAFNPPKSPEQLANEAAEAARANRGSGPTMAATGEGGRLEDSSRSWQDKNAFSAPGALLGGPGEGSDAETETDSIEEGEAETGAHGDAQVQARDVTEFQREESQEPKAGHSNSLERIRAETEGPHVEVYQAENLEDAQAQLKTFTGPHIISAVIRVKYSIVVVRE